MLEAELLSFVRSSIRSTWALELLLYMKQRSPRTYPPAELVRELRAADSLIETCLQQLRAAGLAAPDDRGAWSYAPSTPALGALCEALADAYRQRPFAVINAIVATPNERLKSFADAFRITRKED